MPLSSAGLVVVLVLLLAGGFALAHNGFDNDLAGLLGVRALRVDTWAEWCDHVAALDLHRKYGAMDVTYGFDSIRADFVRSYEPIFARESLANSGADRDPSELIREQQIRVWNSGTALNIENRVTGQHRLWAASVEAKLKQDWSGLTHEEFLVYATISSIFSEVVLHGRDSLATTIRLPFVAGE